MVSAAAVQKAKALIASDVVFVASKSYCPYCNKTKSLLSSLDVAHINIIELDVESDGAELQEALYEITGQRTVPNVFIGGKHIGGNSDLQALNSSGKLKGVLTDAGAF